MRFKVPKNDQQTAPYARADFGLEAVIRNPLGVGEVAAAAQLAERTKFQSDVFSRRSKPSSRSLSVGQQSSTLRLLHLSARKSRHRRIKTGRHKPVIPAVTFLTPLSGHHPPRIKDRYVLFSHQNSRRDDSLSRIGPFAICLKLTT